MSALGGQDSDATRARYVAIITDGNGRWAKGRHLPVVAGHEAGADTVKARLRDAVELGIDELTVYSFSTENWNRSKREVSALMAMFGRRIRSETPELHDAGGANALHRPPPAPRCRRSWWRRWNGLRN